MARRFSPISRSALRALEYIAEETALADLADKAVDKATDRKRAEDAIEEARRKREAKQRTRSSD